jgi:hypothetical protein
MSGRSASSPSATSTLVFDWRGADESCYGVRGMDPLDDPFTAGFDSPELHEAQRRAHWERAFGSPPPERRPDSEAPPVNQEWIDGLLDGGLSQETADLAFRHVMTYPSWTLAYERAAYTRYLATLDRADPSDELPSEGTA